LRIAKVRRSSKWSKTSPTWSRMATYAFYLT